MHLYIALSEFARRKFIAAGLSPEKIVVKPNFVHPDPGVGDGEGGFALFAGRLTAEKGIGTLISAWETAGLEVPLKIIGDGELREDVESAARRLGGVEWLGAQDRDSVLAAMKRATVLLVPSTWYENFPMVIAEALATGLPVLASDLGSLSEVVRPGRTGLLFEAGNAADLATQLEAMLARPERLAAMRREARVEFEARYSTESSYRSLLRVYRQAVSGPGP